MDEKTGGTPSIASGQPTTYLLYLPVRNTLVDASAAVGVPVGSYIAGTGPQNALAVPNAPSTSSTRAVGDIAPLLRGGSDAIVWYGTSIQQGGVASRAGTLYDSIIGRQLNREVLNFGFAGHGIMDIAVAKYLVRLSAAVIVVDCLPNMNAASVARKTVPLVRYLRANGHATTPIVLVENTHGANTGQWFNSQQTASTIAMDAALRDAYNQLQAEGDPALHYVRGSQLFAGQEGEGLLANPTVGGTHPSDIGEYDMAAFYVPFFRDLLGP
jgi:hypothetical protein